MARLRVEVVYALAGVQKIVTLELPAGANVGDAVAASGLTSGKLRLGIGGHEAALGQKLQEGDRVEILRPLAQDPKEARRLRARASRHRLPPRV